MYVQNYFIFFSYFLLKNFPIVLCKVDGTILVFGIGCSIDARPLFAIKKNNHKEEPIMKCPNVESVVEALSGDVVDTIPTKRNMMFAPRSLKLLQENALLTASENRCRAILANSAINDTASLAMSVDRLSHVAPLGKPYYHKILAAYADNAAKTIERW